jgi:sodium/bile acid cotransporter 7
VLLVAAIGYAGCTDDPGASGLTDPDKAAAVARLYASYRKELPTVPEIGAEKAVRLAAQVPPGAVFADVRTDAERAVSMLPGAVPAADVLGHPELFRGRPVVGYCTIGYRSAAFTAEAVRLGLDGRNLAGGILAWTFAGGPVRDAAGETRRVHVYGAKWNYLPAGWIAVW